MAGRTLGVSMEIGAALGSTFKSTFGGAESRVKELGSTIRKLKSEPTPQADGKLLSAQG